MGAVNISAWIKWATLPRGCQGYWVSHSWFRVNFAAIQWNSNCGLNAAQGRCISYKRSVETDCEFERGELPFESSSLLLRAPCFSRQHSSTDSLRILLFWTCWNLDYLGEGKEERERERERNCFSQSADWIVGESFLSGALLNPGCLVLLFIQSDVA